MLVKLPNGGQVKVGVRYSEERKPKREKEVLVSRNTEVAFEIVGASVTFKGESVCKVRNQFSRLEGRKIALTRAIEVARQSGFLVTKEERRALYVAVLPSLFRPKFLKQFKRFLRSKMFSQDCSREMLRELVRRKRTTPQMRRVAEKEKIFDV